MSLSKKEIIIWLKEYNISPYTLVPDDKYNFTVNVDNNVNLSNKYLKKIPIKFNIVNGNFDCSFNELISLEGSPKIVKKNFKCHDNLLTSLEYSPLTVGASFDCSQNKITSLKFCPIVEDNFDCSENKLTSLEHAPKAVGAFYCNSNHLTSLEFVPTVIDGNFYGSNNNLQNLEFCPLNVNGYFYVDKNPALGNIQNKIDFKEILKEHLRIQCIIDFADELNDNLKSVGKNKIVKI